MSNDSVVLPSGAPGRPSRRALIVGSLWAAPVVMGLAAAPSAAASSGGQALAKSQATQVVLNKFAPQVRGGWPGGTIYLDAAQVWYDYNAWALSGPSAQSDGPQAATVTWRVVIKDQTGKLVGTLVEERTDSLLKYGNTQVGNRKVSGLPAGTYTVVSEIVTVVFSVYPTGSSFENYNLAASTSVVVD